MQFVIRLMKAMTCATSQSPLGVVIVYLLRMILLLPTAPRLDGDGSTFWSDLSHVLAPITGAVMLRHQKKKRKKKKKPRKLSSSSYSSSSSSSPLISSSLMSSCILFFLNTVAMTSPRVETSTDAVRYNEVFIRRLFFFVSVLLLLL